MLLMLLGIGITSGGPDSLGANPKAVSALASSLRPIKPTLRRIVPGGADWLAVNKLSMQPERRPASCGKDVDACYNCYDNGVDWAGWYSYGIRPLDGTMDLQLWSNDWDDGYCNDQLRRTSTNSGYLPDWVLANHHLDYLGIWVWGPYAADGAHTQTSYSTAYNYLESQEARVYDCAQLLYSGGNPYLKGSNLLGEYNFFEVDNGYPGVVFDAGTLWVGTQYAFWATSITGSYDYGGGFDPFISIHLGQNTDSYNFQAYGTQAQLVNSSGEGGYEQVIYSAPFNGQDGVFIGEWSMTGSSYETDTMYVGFYPVHSGDLANETPTAVPEGLAFTWTQPSGLDRWAVVGVKPGDTDDYDIEVHATHTLDSLWYPYFYAISDAAEGITDFVALNHHNPSLPDGNTYVGTATKWTCDRSAYVEWCQSHGTITDTGTYGPFNFSVNQVAWSWDLYPVCTGSASPVITLDITSGTVDLGFALFDPGSYAAQSRQEAYLDVNNAGPGADEEAQFSYPGSVSSSNPMGLVVYSENFASGSFLIHYSCYEPTVVGAGEREAPGEFYAKVINGQLEVGLPKASVLVVRAYDASGRLVHEETPRLSSGIHRLSLPSSLGRGVYLIRLTYGDRTFTLKLAKR